jgi:hypothetical protein
MNKLIVSVLLLVLPALVRAGSLDGTWRIDQARAGGVVLRTYFVFHQTAATLEGKVVVNGGVDLPLRHAQLDGADAVFSVDWGTRYRVHPDGDTLKVSIIYNAKDHEDAVAVRVPPTAWPGRRRWAGTAGIISRQGRRQTVREKWPTRWCAAAWPPPATSTSTSTIAGKAAAMPQWRDRPNTKFPDMKALADYVHARGP